MAIPKTILDAKQYSRTTAQVDFSGGLNENTREYLIAGNELVECSNIEIRKRGIVIGRKGYGQYQIQGGTDDTKIDLPVRNQHYHTQRDGTYKMLAFGGNSVYSAPKTRVYADADDGNYDVIDIVDTNDGFCRFTQWRDTVFYGTDKSTLGGLISYNDGAATVARTFGNEIVGRVTTTDFTKWFTIVTNETGGSLINSWYAYRITFQIYRGDDFMGESLPGNRTLGTAEGVVQNEQWSRERFDFMQAEVNLSALSIEDNSIELQRPSTIPGFPTDAKTINIYRAGPYKSDGVYHASTVSVNVAGSGYGVNDTLTLTGGTFTTAATLNVDTIGGSGEVLTASVSTTAGAYTVVPSNPVSHSGGGGAGASFIMTWTGDGPVSTQEELDFYFIGSVDIVEYASASSGDILYHDRGEVPIDKQILYQPKRLPPRPRFIEVHKGRMWLAYVVETDPADSTDTTHPHRVYLSVFNSPAVFPTDYWADISPNDGEGITGIKSWRNKILIVFKHNSMWAITGGDGIDPLTGTPNISVELISEDIGCIAPETIVLAEGRIMWLSFRGMYYFDGSTPQPLKTENIEESIRDIPEGKLYDCAAGYHSLERELWFSHADSVDTTENKTIHKFNFITGAWSKHAHPLGAASFVEKQHKNLRPVFFTGSDESSATVLANAGIYETDVGFFDDVSGTSSLGWSFLTKKFDFGRPDIHKDLVAIGLDAHLPNPNTFVYVLCDERLDELVATVTTAIDGHKLVMMNTTKIWGKRFAIRIIASQVDEEGTLFGITFYWRDRKVIADI